MTKRIAALLLLAALVAVPSAWAGAGKTLTIYNWTDYMPQSVLDEFSAETGIKVVYSTYESNEAMFTKLKLMGGKGYDLVVPSTYFVSLMREQGLLAEIDPKALSNFANLDPEVLDKPFDPDNRYSIPYMWGSTGLMINTRQVAPGTVAAWADLKRPELAGRIVMSSDLRDALGLALKVLGHSMNTREEAEIKAAYEWLLELKPAVRVFTSDGAKQVFAGEEAVAGLIFNGDASQIREEMPELEYIYPREGAMLWMDSLCIPAGAANKEGALLFIDFLLRPEIAARIAEEFRYTTPNKAAFALLPEELQNDPIVSPRPEDLVNSEFQTGVGDALPIYEKYWEMLKVAAE